LTKPFDPEILLARARAVLHGRQAENGGSADDKGPAFQYSDGFLDINVERRCVLVNEKRVKLTPVEFRLLVYLARNTGKVLTFDQILCNVWGDEHRGSTDHVHMYISKLRRKLEEDTRNPLYIVTFRGVGYIFEKQELIF